MKLSQKCCHTEFVTALSKAINLIYCRSELAEDQYFDKLNMTSDKLNTTSDKLNTTIKLTFEIASVFY